MESTKPNNLFTEYTNMIKQFKLPGFDVGAIMESRRKDIEALLAANGTALSGVQSLAQKQADILRAAMADVQSLIAQRSGCEGIREQQRAASAGLPQGGDEHAGSGRYCLQDPGGLLRGDQQARG